MEYICGRRQTCRRLGLILGAPFILIHGYGLVLKFMPVPWTINMNQRSTIVKALKYDWVAIDEISPYLAYAVIGAEDSRFCSHHGIDWKAIEKVLDERGAGKSRRGGSTITQQVAKNVYLWNGGGWVRKIPETWLALYLDSIWSKRRIMEVYLNVAEWGDGIFGAEAAAQARFGKSAKNLTAKEAALLASVLPSPNKWRLDPPGDYVQKRAKTLAIRTADVKWGGYGQCVKVDESRMIFSTPKNTKPKESEIVEDIIANESESEDFENLLEDLESTVNESRDQDNSEETVDGISPEL